MIAFGSRRTISINWQALTIVKLEHASLKSQQPVTHLDDKFEGAGKSTIQYR
jgi:hypothetical protein